MIRVANPPAKPLLIFDGDCNFCRRWVARWHERTGDGVEYLPAQDPEIGQRFPEIPREAFAASVQLIETDGTVYSGAQAALRALGRQWWYDRVPGFAPVSEWSYRLVARYRSFFSLVTRVLWGRAVTRPAYGLTREVFVRGLGVIYLIAFVSLWTQIDGLLGSHGIMPASQFMTYQVQGNYWHNGSQAYLMMPTVFWLVCSDAALHWVCGIGTLLSVLVIAGLMTGPALVGLWALYLSLSTVGDVFLGYQWDALLLEVGFLAIWFAPWGFWPRSYWRSAPPKFALWMLRWLAFRLMLCSGVVKLASGDPLWHSLTALTVHYQTQPLPTWTAWYAHQLPVWFQKSCCWVMFGIELVLPFFIFGTRRMRLVAAGGFALLMTLISLSGNYCFFNLLTLLLCVPLLDDAALRWCSGASAKRRPAEDPALHRSAATSRRSTRWRNWVFAPVAALILILTIPTLFRTCRILLKVPRWWFRLSYEATFVTWPFRSVNSYGLFAVMTPTRPEIIVEGSNDGQTWLPYEFKYKPGDLARRPGFVWPHQPRLDWQMWFAALGSYQGNPWFMNFCAKLLQNEPAVTRLLANNPFPEKPPRYIRAVVYEYKFTDFATRQATGQWWQRELKGQYCPVLSLKQ